MCKRWLKPWRERHRAHSKTLAIKNYSLMCITGFGSFLLSISIQRNCLTGNIIYVIVAATDNLSFWVIDGNKEEMLWLLESNRKKIKCLVICVSGNLTYLFRYRWSTMCLYITVFIYSSSKEVLKVLKETIAILLVSLKARFSLRLQRMRATFPSTTSVKKTSNSHI